MPIYKVQAPDGRIIKVEGPEGASPEEIQKQAMALYGPKMRAQQEAAAKEYDPTAGMSTMEKVTAGFGESMDRLGNLFRSDAEVAERERLNKPLEATGAGKVGQVLGDISKGLVAGGAGTLAVKGAAALPTVVRAATAARSAAPVAQAVKGATTTAGFLPGVVGEALGGAALAGAEAAPGERGMDALIGALMGGGGEVAGRTLGRVIAPLGKSKEAFKGAGTEVASDIAKLKDAGFDISSLPASGRTPANVGLMERFEIGLRNLPGLGAGLKKTDQELKDAYTRYLMKQAGGEGIETGTKSGFTALEEAMKANRESLEAAAKPVSRDVIADRLLGVQRNLADVRLPSERAATEAAAATAAARGADVGPAVAGVRAAEQGAEGARAVGAAEGIPDLRGALDAAREKAVAARLAAGENWQSDEAYKAARKEWDALRRAASEVRPTEQAITGAERAVAQTGAGAQKALTRSQEATAKALEAQQTTGWQGFDDLVKDATRPKQLTPADVSELRRRANDLFQQTRTGTDVARKTEKLEAIRQFKTTLDEALDATIDPTKVRAAGPKSFRELARQEGMASTLRATADTAGHGAFSPKAVAKELESVFGPKSARLEPMDVQAVSGALKRRAEGAFAANPEQYKALIAGTLLGTGALTGAASGAKFDEPGSWATPIAAMTAAPLLLGSKTGRKYLTGGAGKRALAGKTAQELLASILTGQADVPGLF